MCTLLGITKHTLHNWVRCRYLVKIGSNTNTRYLDPGPEYADRLKTGRALQMKQNVLPSDVSSKALFTVREIAEIMGWNLKYTQRYLLEKKIPKHKSSYKAVLYDAATVRNMIWKRNRKRGSKQAGPFLLSELIAYFHKWMTTQNSIMPSDSQFENDDLLKKKIEMMMKMPSPEREMAFKDLIHKMNIAQAVCSIPE